MKHHISLVGVVLVAGCNLALHAGGGSSGIRNAGGDGASSAGGGDSASTWKRFTLKDIELGVALSKVPGFTCGPDPALHNFSTYRHTCVMFLDARCQGRPSKIFHIRSAADFPDGQICFMDEGNGGTYLDKKYMAPPLSAVAIVATDTRSQRVYEIRYTLAKDTLTDDSKLGQALIAKYGRPTSANAPISMTWASGDTHLEASCGGTEGPGGAFCTLTVSDTGLLDLERTKQKAVDDEAARSAAPTPTL